MLAGLVSGHLRPAPGCQGIFILLMLATLPRSRYAGWRRRARAAAGMKKRRSREALRRRPASPGPWRSGRAAAAYCAGMATLGRLGMLPVTAIMVTISTVSA